MVLWCRLKYCVWHPNRRAEWYYSGGGLPCIEQIGAVVRDAKHVINHDFRAVFTSTLPSLTIARQLPDADASADCFGPHQPPVRCGGASRSGRISARGRRDLGLSVHVQEGRTRGARRRLVFFLPLATSGARIRS